MSMSENVAQPKDTPMGEARSSDTTTDSNGIVKVSTLGSAGLKSLIGRRIDGEDIVKMSRRMKGAVRDEFIGYLEILSKNGQIFCRCAKRADIVTATDGMKTMVGTDCLTATSPCCFVLGRLGLPGIAKSNAKVVSASGQSKSAVQPSTSSSQTKTIAAKKPLAPVSKPTPKKPTKLTIDRSAGLLTKSGLYVTITDSSSRLNVASEVLTRKPPTKSRKGTPAPTLIASSIASTSASTPHTSDPDFRANAACFDPTTMQDSANVLDMSMLNTRIVPNSFELLQMLCPHFFDTSIDELLASQPPPSTSIDPEVINDIMLDLSEFFSDPNMLSGLDPVMLNQQALPPVSNSVNLSIMNKQSYCSGQFISSDIPILQPSCLSSSLSSEQERLREKSLLDPAFMDLFCDGGNVTNSPFSTAGSLDLMMTNCDLESLDGSTSVFSNTPIQLGDILNSLSPENAIIQPAPWLPTLPDKDFPNVSPTSSISSISSFTTSSSTVSGTHIELPRAPSRKRQYPSTSIPTTTAASLPTTSKRLSTPDLRKPSVRSTPTPTSGTPVAGAVVNSPAKSQSLSRRAPDNLALNSTAPAIPRARSLLIPNGANKPSTSRESSSTAPAMTRGTVGRGVGRVPTATASRATRPRAPVVSSIPAAVGKKAAVVARKAAPAPALGDLIDVVDAPISPSACGHSIDMNFFILDEIVMQDMVAPDVVVEEEGNAPKHTAVVAKPPVSALFNTFFDVAMDVDTGDVVVEDIAASAEKVYLTSAVADDWFF